MAHTKNLEIRTKRDRQIEAVQSSRMAKKLPAMELEIEHGPLLVEVSYERMGDDVLYRFRYSQQKTDELLNVDAYMTRETFLGVKTPGEALDFLSVTGLFRSRMMLFRSATRRCVGANFNCGRS